MKILIMMIFLGVSAMAAYEDWKNREIEDGCHLAIAALALAGIWILPEVTVRERAAGFFCVSVPMLLIAMAVPGAFGGGDIKFMAACGLFLGWKLALVSAIAAVFAAGAYAVCALAEKKLAWKDAFAFGPFLCVGVAMGLLYGREFISWWCC